MTHQEQQKLELWLRKLEGASVPVFTQSVREVTGVAAAAETSAHDLARAIGRDAALTARLLKVANSPLFNLQRRRIETISAAVVLMGFDAVRDLAVSLSVIEQVLKGRRHERVTRTMARAFHAAAQSRAFALSRRDPCPEEVFVAALLLQLGEMIFWSMAEEEAAAIDRMTAAGASLAEAERRVLGFRLDALTRRLVEDWRLGSLLESAVVPSGCGDDRVLNVTLGHEIADAVERFGWSSDEVRRLMPRIAETLGVPVAEAVALAEENVREATRIAARFGVPRIEAYVLDGPAAEPEPREATPQPDPRRQLQALQEIGAMLEGATDLDALTDAVIGGIEAGVGFRRAFVALLGPDRTRLVVRRSSDADFPAAIELGTPGQPHLVDAVLRAGKALLVNADNRRSMAPLVTGPLAGWVARTSCAFMPLKTAAGVKGLLYADNGPDGPEIDADAFAAFRHFGQQLAIGLAAAQDDRRAMG